MAALFALLHPDQSSGTTAAERVKGLEQAGFLKVLGPAYVTKSNEGKVEHHGEAKPVRSGAAKGLALGALTGVIFAVPVLGIAVGTATGAVIGRHRDSGAAGDVSNFAKSVAEALQPGVSALLPLADTSSPERLRQELGPLGGRFMSTDLSEERIADIQAQLNKASAS